MRMRERKAVLEGELGTGPGRCVWGAVPHHPLASVDAGCRPHITDKPAGSWASVRAGPQPSVLSQLLIWSNLQPLQRSKWRIKEAGPQRPEHRALPEVPSSKQPPLTPPCPSGASLPCTVHPRYVFMKLCRPREGIQPRAPSGL